MRPYGNSGGESGVRSYETSGRSIVIEFRDGEKYLYNYDMPGKAEVEEMKRLAETGAGLTTYINKHVRGRYAKKLD
jgi:hypothetical protein